jgi:hypothetical protein
MRREEAEREAAWRNEHDERRGRLEFYAFDPSAGLAADAWEVSMRLRGEPAWDAEAPAQLDAAIAAPQELAEPAGAYLPPEPVEAAPLPARPRRSERRRARLQALRRRPGRRRRAEEVGAEVDEVAVEPRSPLRRTVRVVGGAVIGVALLWVGTTTALVLLVGATSPTGLALYGLAVLVGLVAIGLGVVIRRS